jgi:hypothetical protein
MYLPKYSMRPVLGRKKVRGKNKSNNNKREKERNYVDPRNVERPVADVLSSEDEEDDGEGSDADDTWIYLDPRPCHRGRSLALAEIWVHAGPERVGKASQDLPRAAECHDLEWFGHFCADYPGAKVRVEPSPVFGTPLNEGDGCHPTGCPPGGYPHRELAVGLHPAQ